MEWWKRKLSLEGAVFFRGQLPPKEQDFGFLSANAITLKPSQRNTRTDWSIGLSHPEWGEAKLEHKSTDVVPPREVFEYSQLTKSEKELALASGSVVCLSMDSRHSHILRDRKLLLRFIRAVMGDDGLVALDMLSQRVWSREALDDELAHDADLDIEGVMTVQSVTENGGSPYWVHTHGLMEIGGFDVDILDPCPDIWHATFLEVCRATAFHIMEGSLGPSTPKFTLMYPGGAIRMVEMDRFLREVDSKRRRQFNLGVDLSHRRNRSVLCEPTKSFLGGIFGSKSPEPARFLTRVLPEQPVFMFSSTASALMAERARSTYAMLRSINEELAEFGFPVLIKLGLQTDGNGSTSKEHLWFETERLFSDSIDATLANQPYHIARLKEGDRGRYGVEPISDWVVMTPAGMITPRCTHPLRRIRAEKDSIREMLRRAKENPQQA